MDNPVTSNLAEFGNKEIAEAGKILTLYSEDKLTKIARDYFYTEGVNICFNKNSGYVFLSNSEYQVLMENDGKLDLFIYCSEHGSEGVLSDLVFDRKNGNVPDEDWKEIIDNYSEYLTEEEVKL